MNRKLDKIFSNSKRIKISDGTKIVIMSDCHRGDGGSGDNFFKNKDIFDASLDYYYKKGFTYVELGDGDEMWEVSKYEDIVKEYLATFKKLKSFYKKNRFVMIYGNHDKAKTHREILDKYFYRYYDTDEKKEVPLLDGLRVYESVVLDYYGYDIFLLHGHQVDFLNGTLWRLSKFLVRNVWSKLEHLGIKDPTSAAKNYNVAKRIEKRLEKWSIENNKILIAGHTHRPIFPKNGSLYFNDGSCVHPDGITGIEIERGKITLVKWEQEIDSHSKVVVNRKVLAGSEKLASFFLKRSE